MSILRRSTCAPSGNSPARIRRNRSRFSAIGAVAIRRRRAGLGQRAARRAHFVGTLAVDVGEPLPDEPLGELVEPVVIIRRVVAMHSPVESQPAHRIRDRILVLDIFLGRIGVVVPEVADAAVFRGEAEIEADRLGVSVVQVAVRLGRKTRDDAAPVLAGAHVLGDDGPQEIGRGRRRAIRRAAGAVGRAWRDRSRGSGGQTVRHCSIRHRLFMNNCRSSGILTGRLSRVMGGNSISSPGLPANPRQPRLSRHLLTVGRAGFPQMLWIIVCISCKFER